MRASKELIGIFVEEMDELLGGIDVYFAALREDSGDTNAIFELHRLAHTLKTSAGMMGFDCAREYAKAAEAMVAPYHKGEMTPGVHDLAFMAGVFGFIRTIMQHIEETEEEDSAAIISNTESILEFSTG